MEKIKNKMQRFYSEKIILSNDKVIDLRDKKKKNIDRLKNGIKKYNEDNNTDYKLCESIEQGSIAMSTAIDPEYDDFDIDVGIIFEKNNIPNNTDDIKKLVVDFFKPYNYLFKRNPIKKTNCIRIEYQDNYHIDFAIYRTENDYYEHCGNEWTERNPRSITNWFYEQNKMYNNKLREITRFIKYFAKTRKEWKICGGLIITILVSEQLNTLDVESDIDELLKKVILNIIDRIKNNTSVKNPVNDQELITNDLQREKLNNLSSKLDMFSDKLTSAYNNQNEEEILKCWNDFFKTDYFVLNKKQNNKLCENNEMFIENLYKVNRKAPVFFKIKCQRYVSKDNFNKCTQINCYDDQPFSLHDNKDERIGFSIETSVSKPYILLWKIKNNGIKAVENNMLRGEICYGNTLLSNDDDINSYQRFENINFEGNHYVECYLIKNNQCLAKSRFNVKIC